MAFSTATPFCNLLVLLCLIQFSAEKRLRLPILLRTPKIECNFENDECGINQSLDNFELYQNSTYIAGRCKYYEFAIQERMPIQVGRFHTSFFPNLESNVGCLHLDYNVQGMDTFVFVVSQRTNSSAPRVLYSQFVSRSSHWIRSDIQIHLYSTESQFIVEVLCQYCSPGAKFLVSRIFFDWESCQS